MRSLPRFALRHPVFWSSIVLALPLVAVPGLIRLEVRTDGRALVPDRPEAITARHLADEFGFWDPVVLLLRSRHTAGVFHPDALRAIRDLTETARELAGPDSTAVTSLATETSDRFVPGTLRFRPFLDPVPETASAIRELESDLAALEIYDGTLVSLDATAAAVLLPVPEGEDRGAFLGRLAEAAHVESDSLEVTVVGEPAAEALLGSHLLADLSRLLPVVFAWIALLFALRFRAATAVLLPLAQITACLALVFGGAGWAGVPVYLTTAVLPVILSTIVIADQIHVLTRLVQVRSADREKTVRGAVAETMEEMASPVSKTSLTTAIGFLSFAISDLAPVRAFGVLAALGVLYSLLFSLTVVPATLARFGAGVVRTRERGSGGPPPWFARAIVAGRRHRKVTLAAAGLVVLAGAAFARRVQVQDSWVGGFARGSAFRVATEFVDEQFLGSALLRFVVRAGSVSRSGRVAGRDIGHHEVRLPAGDAGDPERLRGSRFRVWRAPEEGTSASTPVPYWSAAVESVHVRGDTVLVSLPPKRGSPRLLLLVDDDETLSWSIRSRPFADPPVLRATDRFERFLRTQDGVGGVLGPATYLKTTRFIVTRRVPDWRSIPRSPYEIDQLWSNYARIRGDVALRELLAEDLSAGVVTAYLRHANFVDTAALLDSVRTYEQDHLVPDGLRVEAAGSIAVSQALISVIVDTQVRSLLLALLGVLAVTTWLNRSVRWGVICVVPCALAVLVVFAGMAAGGVPLGVATSMFAGMCLGVGVDFAIHFVDRFRLVRDRGVPTTVALDAAANVAGPAILLDAAVVATGFGALMLSSVPLNARLGLIAVICVTTAMLATFLLLPSLLPGEAQREE